MNQIFFQVKKGQVIEHGEGHSSIAKRDGMAYFEGDELKMISQAALVELPIVMYWVDGSPLVKLIDAQAAIEAAKNHGLR